MAPHGYTVLALVGVWPVGMTSLKEGVQNDPEEYASQDCDASRDAQLVKVVELRLETFERLGDDVEQRGGEKCTGREDGGVREVDLVRDALVGHEQ